MNKTDNRMRIAIQKSGRLSDASFQWLASYGIAMQLQKEQLFVQSDQLPIDLLLVRDDDIPRLVSTGSCDFGIVGTNILQEQWLQNDSDEKKYYEIIQYLGFALCRLSLAVPKNFLYQNLNSLNRCRIATSYPNILSDFIKKNNLKMEITLLTGSVEIAPRLGIAEGICDLVSTGKTLAVNYLREVAVIFNSEAVLIASSQSFSKEKQNFFNFFQNDCQS